MEETEVALIYGARALHIHCPLPTAPWAWLRNAVLGVEQAASSSVRAVAGSSSIGAWCRDLWRPQVLIANEQPHADGRMESCCCLPLLGKAACSRHRHLILRWAEGGAAALAGCTTSI